MLFPLSLWDIALWLAVTATILLLTSEFLSPYYGQTGIKVNIYRLRIVALTIGFLFLLIVLIRLYHMILQ